MINEQYKKFDLLVSSIRNIDKVFKSDVFNVIEYTRKNKITIKDFFTSEYNIEHFRNIDLVSPVSLIIFDKLFNINNSLNNNIYKDLEEKEKEKYKIMFTKTNFVLQKYLIHDYKKIYNSVIKEIKSNGF